MLDTCSPTTRDRVFAALCLLFVLALGGGFAPPAGASLLSSFDADAEGWRITGDNTSTWSATGGNPDGCVYVNDTAIGAFNAAVAPPAYLGDWSGVSASDSLHFDVYFRRIDGTVGAGPYTFRIVGPGGAANALVGYTPPQLVWTTVSVAMDPSEWTIESGTWSGILSHVTSLLLGVEYVSGNEEVRIDNVRFSGPVTPVFNPCESDIFTALDLGDWSFANTNGVTNPGSDGNRGGFARITDGAGTTYAFAPSRFLGDWTSLVGHGRVTVDVRLLSRAAAPVDIPEFIRLAGPGGSAVVPLAGADVPASAVVWKTFEYPLQENVWTMTSGTWAGLMQNVTEVRIQADIVAGTEVFGIDNFGRLAGNCPPLDDPIVVHTPEYESCGFESFIGVGAIAKNPVDGQLYGLVDAASGSGGGLYRVTGTDPGVRLFAYVQPANLLFDELGHCFVSEDFAGNIYRFSNIGTSSLWVSGFQAGDDDPTGMCFAPAGFDGPNVDAGDALVIDAGFGGPDSFWSFQSTAPENERAIVVDLPGDPNFRDITTGPFGIVYATDTLDHDNLYAITPDGVFTPVPLQTTVGSQISLAYAPMEAKVYVLETTTHTLRRIDPATGAVELIASGFDGFSDGAIEIDPATGALWISDIGAGRVYRLCPTTPTAVDGLDEGAVLGGVTRVIGAVAVWPNPARSGATSVAFALRHETDARVTVYDLAGRVVRRLADGRASAGERTLTWDRRDDEGRAVATGVYMVRVEAQGETRSARVVVLR